MYSSRTTASFRHRFAAAALAGAALFATGPAAAATFTFSGGTYAPGVTSPNPLLAPDVLEIVGGANKAFGGSDFTNLSGTVNWFNGTIFLSGGSADVSNQGVWNMLGNNVMTLSNGGGTFTNGGTLAKTGGTGTSTFGVPFFNSGTIDAQTGTILLNGMSTFSAGSIFTGVGIVEVGANATFNGAFTSSSLDFAGNTYTGVGAVLNGSADFLSGNFDGGWSVADGAALTIAGSSNKSFSTGTFTNNGTVDWTAATLFLSGGAAAVINEGSWNATGNNVMTLSNGGGSFTNNGTVVKSAATGATTFGTAFTNNGTIDAQTGTVLLNGSGITINAGSDFTGAGSVDIGNSATFNGGFTSYNLDFTSGNYTGVAAALTGTADFLAGNFTGAWTVNGGSALTIAGGSNKSFSPGTFTNNGTVNWTAATLFLSGGATDVVNNGVWNATGDNVLTVSGGGGTFTNNGVFTKSAGTGATTIQTALVQNGEINAASGTVLLNGGPITVNAGASFTGAGDVNLGNSATFNGGFSSTSLNFTGGNFTGAGAALTGSADYLGGAFAGDWTVTSGSTFTIADAGNKSFSGSFTNQGTVEWTASTIFLTGGAAFTNAGTLTATGDNVMTISSGGGTLTNTGLIQKTAGTGTTSLSQIGLSNTGTISVESGTIALPSNFTNGGTLTGSSLFALSGTLTNNGTVAPGVGVGTLGLNGSYAQTALGTLAIQLGGGTADLFTVSGNAALNGTLALFCASCSLTAGDTFTLLDSAGDLSGSFANVTASGFLQGFAYDVLYDTALDRVQLVVTDPGMNPTGVVPEPQSWAMLILGFGLVGGAARRRHAGRRLARA